MRVNALESELSRVRDECGSLSRRCIELENEKQEAALLMEHNYRLSQGVFRRNQMLEKKLLDQGDHDHAGEAEAQAQAEAEAEEKHVMGHHGRSWKRTEEWVQMHLGIQMEAIQEPWDGSVGSSCWEGSNSVGAHINPDDSASQDGAWKRIAVGTQPEPDTDLFGSKSMERMERMLDVSKRMCPSSQRNRADKVARSPWKTSVDVNPVYQSQMLFGRLMGNLAAKAAASGAFEDALSREAFY